MPDDNKPRSAGHVERADPEGSIRSSIEDGRLLKDPLARFFLTALGAPPEVLYGMVALSDELSSLVTGYERWAPLTGIGWPITDLANPHVYDLPSCSMPETWRPQRRCWRTTGTNPANWNRLSSGFCVSPHTPRYGSELADGGCSSWSWPSATTVRRDTTPPSRLPLHKQKE